MNLDIYLWLEYVWFVYAVFEGYREGSFFHYRFASCNEKMTKREGRKLHFWWTVQRSIPLISLGIIANSWFLALLFALEFPFLHDGAYYTRRHMLNDGIYHRGWLAQSTTSTALLTSLFKPATRTTLFIAVNIILLTQRVDYFETLIENWFF